VLGSFNNSLTRAGIETLPSRPYSRAAAKGAKKQAQAPDQLIDLEWSELPYTMMRLTAARRPWDNKRIYWRDRTVQLGDIELKLIRHAGRNQESGYKAVYSLDDLHRDFTLQPVLEGDGLRWSAPGISDLPLTADQLAETLLSKLVTFYTVGILSGATLSASPNLSS